MSIDLERAGERYQRVAAEAMPMRRIGVSPEVADAVVWLSSPQSFVTGTTVVIDGGKMAGAPPVSTKISSRTAAGRASDSDRGAGRPAEVTS